MVLVLKQAHASHPAWQEDTRATDATLSCPQACGADLEGETEGALVLRRTVQGL